MANIEVLKGNKGALPNRPRILLCVFSYAGVNGHTMSCLLAEMRKMDALGIEFLLVNVDDDALISRSRSKALSAFVQNNRLDVCVMVDHDLEWEVGSIIALAVKAHQMKACVSGIYSARAIGRGSGSRPKSDVMMRPGEDQLVEAEYLSGGFLAIPHVVAEEVLREGLNAKKKLYGDVDGDREALTERAAETANMALHPCAYNVGPVIYDFFRPICVPRTFDKPGLPQEASYEFLSEDWAFSWRCTKANPGRALYLWSLPWLLHHGDSCRNSVPHCPQSNCS